MPELPEVITIRNDLRKEVLGKKITAIKTYSGYKLQPSKGAFEKHVLLSSISNISNIAKLLLIELSSGQFLAIHLNMTGLLLYNTKDPYIKVAFHFDTGDILHYSSIRMFGYCEVWDKTKVGLYRLNYGKSAIESDLSLEEFVQKISKTSTTIKTALLNQKLISGIGNIYANDALFMAGIHPKKRASDIPADKLKLLFEKVKEILAEGVKHRGSTIDRYRDLYGKMGSQQNYFRIYGKKDKLCMQCKVSTVVSEKIQGRGTYYCEVCQPLSNQAGLF